MWGILSDERASCNFTVGSGSRQLRNGCAVIGQQQFTREKPDVGRTQRLTTFSCFVSSRYLATTIEDLCVL
jgi:hypothetical protein